MTVDAPTFSQLQRIAEDVGLHLNRDEVSAYLELMDGVVASYKAIDEMPTLVSAPRHPRTEWHCPKPSENPCNAWYVKATVKGESTGKLLGRTVALKDNICLAGVPMMVGASTLEGYVPDIDATVVTRILDAGGTILGKATCEYFCLSGSSHTAATGWVSNPWKKGFSAGGSSSGSGALVALAEVDMAIGGDQGGSIRIPSAFCGVVGLKPTYGLVPYTGVMPIELTLDHIGPMTRTVRDNALFLEVLAGPDGDDSRQCASAPTDYLSSLDSDIGNLRIGVVAEGFGHKGSDPEVDECVRAAIGVLNRLGATTREVSLPLHTLGKAIWTPIAIEGLTSLMLEANAGGTNYRGPFITSLIDAHASWRSRCDEFPATVKFVLLAGEYMSKRYGSLYYAKAQQQSRRLRASYDELLRSYDLLAMPTVPKRPTALPPRDAPIGEIVSHAFELNANCIPTNLTGHPALSVPCGRSGGLPVGLMMIGRHFDEATVFRAAHAYERAVD